MGLRLVVETQFNLQPVQPVRAHRVSDSRQRDVQQVRAALAGRLENLTADGVAPSPELADAAIRTQRSLIALAVNLDERLRSLGEV